MEVEALLRRKRSLNDLVNKWLPRWSRAILRIYNLHIEAHGAYVEDGRIYPGCSPDGVGRIFVMNHRSSMDIPIVLRYFQAHVISRHDLASWPLIGRSARRVGTLFVDRSSRRSGASVLKEVARVLRVGEGVAMFPEGTAFAGDEVHEFRPGAFNAARRTGAQIVPVGIAYGDEAAYYRKEPFLTHIQRVGSLPQLRVALEIGEPLETGGRSSVEMKNLARECVQELVTRARARLDG